MFKAVIFDRDGVILDSESVHINSTIYAFNKLGISLNEEEIDELIGKHPEDYKIYLLKKYSFSYDDFRKIQKEKYYNLLESAPFFDRIINLIKKLHSMNIPPRNHNLRIKKKYNTNNTKSWFRKSVY